MVAEQTLRDSEKGAGRSPWDGARADRRCMVPPAITLRRAHPDHTEKARTWPTLGRFRKHFTELFHGQSMKRGRNLGTTIWPPSSRCPSLVSDVAS